MFRQVVVAMNDPYYDGGPSGLQIFGWVCGVLSMGAGIVRLVVFVLMRMQIREKYNLRGTCVEDCCYSFWCASCVLCQMMAEVNIV